MKRLLINALIVAVVVAPIVVLEMLCGCASISSVANGGTEKAVAPKYLLSSCWNGANAQMRAMNTLSPGMSEAKFQQYLNWQKSRTLVGYGRANVAHVFLSNRRDGENAGYCIYGNEWDWTVDAKFVAVMKARIKAYRKAGFQVCGWVLADDSTPYAAQAKRDFNRMMKDLKASGLLDDLSIVVPGLEWNEYLSAADMAKLVAACKSYWKGPIGTHMTSGKISAYGDYVFYQVSPGKSAAWLAAETKRVKAGIGNRKLVMFEIERNPAPAKCKAIMDTGAAVGCGNI